VCGRIKELCREEGGARGWGPSTPTRAPFVPHRNPPYLSLICSCEMLPPHTLPCPAIAPPPPCATPNVSSCE
jgi:hypothetical protein